MRIDKLQSLNKCPPYNLSGQGQKLCVNKQPTVSLPPNAHLTLSGGVIADSGSSDAIDLRGSISTGPSCTMWAWVTFFSVKV